MLCSNQLVSLPSHLYKGQLLPHVCLLLCQALG
jgi:hypothetical protein